MPPGPYLIACPEGSEPHLLEVPREGGELTFLVCPEGHVVGWPEARALVQDQGPLAS